MNLQLSGMPAKKRVGAVKNFNCPDPLFSRPVNIFNQLSQKKVAPVKNINGPVEIFNGPVEKRGEAVKVFNRLSRKRGIPVKNFNQLPQIWGEPTRHFASCSSKTLFAPYHGAIYAT